MTEHEKIMVRMRHKLQCLKKQMEFLEVAVIDEDIYKISNLLYELKVEIEKQYNVVEKGEWKWLS